MIEPRRFELDLTCDPEHASETWTERFSTWWPRGHSVSGDPVAVELERRLGGRIYERIASSEEIDWGWITALDPPNRLGYRWHIRRPPSEATDVEVRFAPHESGGTRLEIIHSGWERFAADARSWRDANQGGWAGLLPHFVAACDPNGQGGIA